MLTAYTKNTDLLLGDHVAKSLKATFVPQALKSSKQTMTGPHLNPTISWKESNDSSVELQQHVSLKNKNHSVYQATIEEAENINAKQTDIW